MEDAGEKWQRKQGRKKLAILLVIVLLSGLAPFVIQIAGDQGVVFHHAAKHWGPHLPPAVRIVIAVAFFGGLAFVARWNWLASDEVRRSHIVSYWAAIGISVSLTFFGFLMFGRAIPEDDRLQVAFLAPLVLGSVISGLRSWRDGFVW